MQKLNKEEGKKQENVNDGEEKRKKDRWKEPMICLVILSALWQQEDGISGKVIDQNENVPEHILILQQFGAMSHAMFYRLF